ncbi:MAG TPA: AarF/ABC1/UbiB kinase family protein [Acidimicrobiales bacterium]|nr:AarF/ABC1/UbiB kinase family protein [Acidimicrobiales bacterium]
MTRRAADAGADSAPPLPRRPPARPLTEDVPRIYPRRLPDPTRRQLLRRSRTITKVVAVHFTPTVLRQLRTIRHGALPAAQLARPLRKSFQDLGGTFMKFGQIIASSPGMFGDDVADEFRATLDTGPAVPFADVRQRVEEDLGLSLRDAFTAFDPVPIGTASIAVVHRARLLDGRLVAVKVLRPDIEQVVATDLDLMQPLLEILVRQTGDQMAGNVLQLLDGFRVQIGEEMDLRNEARSLVHFRRLQNEFDLKLMAVPEPHLHLSGRNVLTMEFFDGVPIDDLAKVADLGYDPTPLVQEVMRAFFLTTVRWGAFHGDVHAGNMMLLRDGRIGVIDWGIVGRLDPSTHRFFIALLSAAMGNEDAWPVVTKHITDVYGPAISVAVGLSGDELTAFFRSILEPALTRPFGEVSLAGIMQTIQLQMAQAQGVEAHRRSLRAIMRRLRTQRRVRRLADQAGGLMSEFDRGMFLLAKQLMYFERYGRMFVSEVPILNDRVFLEQLLAGVDMSTLTG